MEFSDGDTGLGRGSAFSLKWAPVVAVQPGHRAACTHRSATGIRLFHHGTWFQTTERRPLMYLFEDNGGASWAPCHGGRHRGGRAVWHTSAADLKYKRERRQTAAGLIREHVVARPRRDERPRRSNLWVAPRHPRGLHGLEIGGEAATLTRSPPDGVARTESMREHIFNRIRRLRARSRRADRGGLAPSSTVSPPPDFGTWAGLRAGLLEAGARYRPYYRLDRVDGRKRRSLISPPVDDTVPHAGAGAVDVSAWVRPSRVSITALRSDGVDTDRRPRLKSPSPSEHARAPRVPCRRRDPPRRHRPGRPDIAIIVPSRQPPGPTFVARPICAGSFASISKRWKSGERVDVVLQGRGEREAGM